MDAHARTAEGRRIRQLVGIYTFDASLAGGAGYLAARLAGIDCPLRTLTHRGLRANPEWSAMAAELIVPVLLSYHNRVPAPVREAAGDRRPCVLASSRAGATVLLGPGDLERIAGRVALFLDEIRRSAADAGLTWTRPMWDSDPAPLCAA